MIHRLEEFKNLLAVAMADGSMTQREIEFLSERAHRWGISDHEFGEAVDYAIGHRGEVSIPRKRADRIEMLREMLRMMAADGAMPEMEKRLFATVAAVMKIDRDELNALIDGVIRQAIADRPAERQRDEVPPPVPARRKKTRAVSSRANKPGSPTPRRRR